MTGKPTIRSLEVALKCPNCGSNDFMLVRRWMLGQYTGQKVKDIPMRVVCSDCDMLIPDIQIIDLYNLPD